MHREFSVVSYTLLLAMVEFKTLVMREQLEAAWALLPNIPQVRLPRCPLPSARCHPWL